MLDETTMESWLLNNALTEMSSPFPTVLFQQSIGPALGLQGLGTERFSASCFHLGANESGPVGLAVFIQPVGIDQPRRVIIAVCNHRAPECIAICHFISIV